ncbi:GntR family transcriptional regulator [Streptomyces sp. LX-29]|uniref:GntR family transcriptional regulator n=1 Tax=Streptomyces sp. LX-29 TaxID=2900152 RepID=UPI00240E1AA4|nr:GntR family transcriptional regulator [Streptomyces sp. LX-29]WFB09603.1 GntR family transcriptional regulator [Streptomyces sp. LX-29]
MPSREIRAERPRYLQLADLLAEDIASGTYEPGSQLPTEADLSARYGLSRQTVRQALTELVAMGLIQKEHGRGSFVRPRQERGVVTRSLVRHGRKIVDDCPLIEGEAPAVTRTHLSGTPGDLLERGGEGGEQAFSVDRLLIDPATGARIAHRLMIPFSVAAETPTLSEQPDAPIETIYAALAAKHSLTWHETVTARPPMPDERAALLIEDASPVLISYRVTAASSGEPLILEELRASAAGVELRFRLTPGKAVPTGKAAAV